MIDLKNLTDEDLRESFNAYRLEVERRNELARVPQEISDLAQYWREMGGEDSTIIDAVTNSLGHPLEIDKPQA